MNRLVLMNHPEQKEENSFIKSLHVFKPAEIYPNKHHGMNMKLHSLPSPICYAVTKRRKISLINKKKTEHINRRKQT